MDGHQYQLLNFVDQWIFVKNFVDGTHAQSLREKCPNTNFFLVRISLYLDQKKLRIWTFFTQWVVRDSRFVPSVVVLSLFHQAEDLTLKLPKVVVNKALLALLFLKIVSNFDKKIRNSLASWFGDLYTTLI